MLEPYRPRKTAWWLLGGTALTIVVYQFEDPDGVARQLNKGAWDELSDFGNIWGDIRVQAPLALGTWGVGSWAGNDRLAGTGFDLSRGLLLTYATVSLLKVAFQPHPSQRGRLFLSLGPYRRRLHDRGRDLAALRRLGGRRGHRSGGAWPRMGRMEDMKHYASDVTAGATIGWIIGRTVARDKIRTDGPHGSWCPSAGGWRWPDASDPKKSAAPVRERRRYRSACRIYFLSRGKARRAAAPAPVRP